MHLARNVTGGFLESLPTQFPKHAPTASASPAWAKETLEIRKTVGNQGQEGEDSFFRHMGCYIVPEEFFLPTITLVE
jgi:hypothetical protein